MLGSKIGFDLGTTSVLAIVEGKGIKVDEPSVIAYDTFTDKIKAVGKEAYKMIGRTPDSLTVIEPIRKGTVFDYEAVQNILRYYIQHICGSQIFKPNILICVPSQTSELDIRTVLDLAISSGAARACVIEEPLAAAVGAGVDFNDYHGTMIVDIGGGTTDIAVVASGLVAVSSSVKTAGNDFDEAICRYLKQEKNIVIGKVTAENVKKEVSAAKILDAELAVRAVGKDDITNLPKVIEVTSTDIFYAIKEQLDIIVENIRLLLQQTPPELNADVSVNGIILTGGGAEIMGIDKYIESKLGIRTGCAKDPRLCVINGIGYFLNNMKVLEENGYVFKSYQDIKDFEEYDD